MTMMGCYERPADRAQHTIRYEALDGAEQTLSVSPGATCFASTSIEAMRKRRPLAKPIVG